VRDRVFESWVQGQPVIYSTGALVRRRKLGGNWVTWNRSLGGGPTIIVRTESLEILAPQGTMLESRHIMMAAKDTVMRLGKVGKVPTPLNRREYVRLVERRGRLKLELAVSPITSTPDLWEALLAAGIRADPKSPRG
jgi:hypothetical protein